MSDAPASSSDPVLPEPLPLEIDVTMLARLRSSTAPHALLDVREPWELKLCRFPESIDIPLGDLAGRIDELPADRPLVIVCRSGRRSLDATQLLREKGLPGAVNLAGGVLSWGETFDPSWPSY